MRMILALLALVLLAPSAEAQSAGTLPGPNGKIIPLSGNLCVNAAGTAVVLCNDPTASVQNMADSNSAAFQGVVAITPGTPVAALRSLGFICTVSGNITLTLADSSTITLPIAAAGTAFQTLPFAVTNVALGSGTAGTFWNLK